MVSSYPAASLRIVLVAIALYLVYEILHRFAIAARRRSLQKQRGCEPVRRLPQWDRVLGLDLFYEDIACLRRHKLLERVHDRFGQMNTNTYSHYALGLGMITTREAENLKHIQAIDFKKWSLPKRRKVGFAPLFGQGIFTTDGAAWQHSRDLLRPNFVRSQVGDLPTFERHVAHLIAAIPKDGTTVDLSELFFRLTIDSATEFLFGESCQSLTQSSAEGFAEAFTRSQDFVANRSRWGGWAKLFPANKQFERDRAFVHAFVDHYVRKGIERRAELLAREKNGGDRYVFLEELVRQTDDPITVRSELLHILLAGRDTTASLLTNVWWVMSKRSDLWARLQAEVSQLNGEIPSFEQLKELKYLRALLNESLRLHPVVPMNSREAMEGTTLPVGGGKDGLSPFFVPKGTRVGWSVYSMHRRTDYYGSDAEEFKPERWLDDPATGKRGVRPSWEYLPFNGGARICLGQQFALTEASYATVRLCQAFKGLESRDPKDYWEEGITLTCVNANGAKVALEARIG